jgi:23S rRNA pseudouridine1911/1915/1917 synthase
VPNIKIVLISINWQNKRVTKISEEPNLNLLQQNKLNYYNVTYTEKTIRTRLDKYLASGFPEFTRSYIQKLIDENNITVNGKPIKSSYLLKYNDDVLLSIPNVEQLEIVSEDIFVPIVYEDNDLVVVNKPQGMCVHPSFGNFTGTLVNAMLFHCAGKLSGINGVARPGIVHRIDKDTTGLLLVAKNDMAHVGLSNQIREHSLTREYKAIVHGRILSPGIINRPIGRDTKNRKKMAVTYVNSKDSVTHFWPIENFKNYTFMRFRLETGRTHQIRVHMSNFGHPIVGDKTYGRKNEEFDLPGQLLCACRLGFLHPRTGKYMKFEIDVPKIFAHTLEKIRTMNK